MESMTIVQWALEHLNYFSITLLMIIESSFIPFPSEIVIPPAAYKAASTGELNVYLVVLFGTLGAVIGALINYGLALYLGRRLVYRFAESRLGALCLLDQEKVQKAEMFFDKHGIVSTLLGRLVPGIRQLISIPAGLAKMRISRFILFTFIGAGIWNSTLAALGYYAESVVPQEELNSYVLQHSHKFAYFFVFLAIVFIVYLVLKSRKKR